MLPSLLVIGLLISMPVRARGFEKTLQNNIHQDTQLDDGHGGDLNDFSYLLCILIWELKQCIRSPYDMI